MKLNRKDEYLTLLDELEQSPPELEYVMQRADARLKKKRISLFAIPAGSIVSFLIVFSMFINFFPSFAYACGRVPFIKELAQAVAFSPSLSAAVENQYVQPVEQEKTINGITAKVEYLIVDEKQLNIFYSLDSDIYSSMDITPEIKSSDGSDLNGFFMSYGDCEYENGNLSRITVDFNEMSIPDSIILEMKVYDNGKNSDGKNELSTDSKLYDDKYVEPEYISSFAFDLIFDPYFTAQGDIIALNEKFQVDGQTLILETAEIYPSHIRMNFSDLKDNTAWLKNFSFYLENENGQKFEKITDGVTATGSVDSPMMKSQRLESSFFSRSKSLTLYITDITWLDKNMEKVKLDLKDVTAESLPQNVIFENAQRRGKGWVLTFAAKNKKANSYYQLWSQDYYDEDGNKYTYDSWSSFNDDVDTFKVQIPLSNYPYDIVYMCPDYSRKVKLENPVEIKVK